MANTDSPAGQADAGTDWQSAYTGMQRLVARKDQELADARRAADERQAGQEADLAELREYRAQRAAAESEETARRTYEALRDRFEDEPPTPMQHGETRSSREAPDDRDYSKPWPV